MFTQTHLLLGAVLFARPGARAITAAGLAGAIVPDADVWLMFVIERFGGSTGCEVFHYRYWEEPWTTLQSILNAILLYIGLLVAAGVMYRTANGHLKRLSTIVLVFALSALLHVGTDFLLHHEDARAQLLPFSHWVFRSPVSYWDPEHLGRVFAGFEIMLAIALIMVVGNRYSRSSVWIGLCVLSLGYFGSVAASFMDLASHDRGPGSCSAEVAIW